MGSSPPVVFMVLRALAQMYIRPMREAKIISQQDMDTIFSNIETIHQIHKNLVQDLRPLFSPPEVQCHPTPPPTHIGDSSALNELLHVQPPAPGEQPQTSTIPSTCLLACQATFTILIQPLSQKQFERIRRLRSRWATSCAPSSRSSRCTQSTSTGADSKRVLSGFRSFFPGSVWPTLWLGPLLSFFCSFDNANKRVTELQNSSKKFSQFLNDCKERPECKKLDLVSYLIMVTLFSLPSLLRSSQLNPPTQPIQRLPRYELLLRDILRHTSDAGEHAKIEQVFNTVAEVNKVRSVPPSLRQ